jgi:multidrug efflux pump subunit AcrA (membrane-fusion protein)
MKAATRMANRRRKRRTVIAVIAVLVAAVLVAVCLLIWKNKNSKAVKVVPVSSVYDTYWGDTLTFEAQVTTGSVQYVDLQSGLVSAINVAEGTSVSKGDVLMTYDTTAFQLTLQTDAAKVAVLESQLTAAQDALATYKTLKPSESAPAPTEITVAGNKTAAATESYITLETAPASGDGGEEPLTYYCDESTVVSGELLEYLSSSGLSARFEIYDGIALCAAWTVESGDLDGTENFSDWTVGSGVTFNGDGTASVSMSSRHYGTLTTYVPDYDDGSYTYYQENYTIDSKGNYAYSKAELAEMIQSKEEEIASLEMDLKEANLTYQKDQLVGKTGNVTASIDGVVTFVGDPNTLAEGSTLLTVKGSENYTVTVYVAESYLDQVTVGEQLNITAYETGSSFTATVTEVGTTPSDSYSYYGGNPNNTMYPVTCVADDPDLELNMGEWCEAELASDQDSEQSIYLPLSVVRDDDSGTYVMVADENNRLTKRYIKTGKTLWGYEVEIKGGVTIDDRIAFPYGTSVKEGAPVVDADSLYDYY